MAKTLEIDVEVNTGEAVKDVDKLTGATEKLGDATEGVSKSTDSLGDSLESVGGSFGGAINGAKGLLTTFKALVLNPIGLTIAAIATAVGVLFKAFSRTEEGGNKLNKGFNLIGATVNSLLKGLEPLAAFIVDKVIGAFETLGSAADSALGFLSDALETLGFDEAAKSVDNFVESTNELIETTSELSDLEAKLLKSRREQSLIEKQALIDAEKLRQQRDDESNSLEERIEFNRQLGEVLAKQSEEELAIANDALKLAQLKLQVDGQTTEALDGLAEAQLELLDIEERINGQRSEQLANENSLRNEGIAAQKEEATRIAEEKQAVADKEAEEAATKLKEQEATDKAEKERKDKIAEEDKKRLEDEANALATVEATKKTIRDASLSNIENGIKLVASLDEDNKGLQAASIIAANAAGIAKTVITTQAANAAAIAEGTALAIPTAGASVAAAASLVAANNISAGISIGTSIAATVKGLAGLKKSGSAGSKPSLPTPSGGGSASAPTINDETLFSSQTLEGADTENVGSGRGVNQIQAVVVESQITDVQNNINDIEARSEIGG